MMYVALEGVQQLSRGIKADVSLIDAKLSEFADRSLNPTPCDSCMETDTGKTMRHIIRALQCCSIVCGSGSSCLARRFTEQHRTAANSDHVSRGQVLKVDKIKAIPPNPKHA